MTIQNNEKNPVRLLWIPVTLAFLLLAAAWTILIKIAREHPTETVPLENPIRLNQKDPHGNRTND